MSRKRRRARIAASKKKWNDANPERLKIHALRAAAKRYGLDSDEVEKYYLNHNGQCDLCKSTDPGGKGRFHIDHCHATGRFRGLLCHKCNIGLGLFNDDPGLLTRAARYIEGYGFD